MTRYCIDTSAYSRFRAGHEGALEVLDAAEWVGVPVVVLGELYTGFLLGRRPAENLAELERFLDHPVVEQQRVDEATARIYAEIVVALREKGRAIPTNDLWIAACAARVGATVLTFDRHFKEVDRVGSLVMT